jgi:hypothetical protein
MRTVRAEIEGEAHYRVPELNRQRAVGVRQAAQSRPGKDSLRLRRKTATWDDDFLVSLLAA